MKEGEVREREPARSLQQQQQQQQQQQRSGRQYGQQAYGQGLYSSQVGLSWTLQLQPLLNMHCSTGCQAHDALLLLLLLLSELR